MKQLLFLLIICNGKTSFCKISIKREELSFLKYVHKNLKRKNEIAVSCLQWKPIFSVDVIDGRRIYSLLEVDKPQYIIRDAEEKEM